MPDERLTGWGWPGLGLAGSLAMTATGPDLAGRGSISWWFILHLPPGHSVDVAVFYAGMAALCVAWLGLGRRLRRAPSAKPAQLVLVGALWCLPLVFGPPLFSHDVYSYMAQGEILRLGLNPYHHGPDVLARFGKTHLLAAVSPFWRATTSPYGPLFLALASVIMAVVGSNLILGVLLMRVLELAGLALLALYTPRLARTLGTDPCRATWMAVISPLVLLELIAAGHNDALMIGLLVAGVTLAMERRPLLGIAATIKLPAAAGIVFIAVAWARDEFEPAVPAAPGRNGAARAPGRNGASRVPGRDGLPAAPGRNGAARAGAAAATRALALSAAATLAVLAAVSALAGVGLSWVSSGVLSTPGKVHLAITPVTAAGWSLASLLHLLGISASSRGIESALGTVALTLTGVLGLALIRRTRYHNLVLLLAALLLVSVFAGPATWPWYLTWGLALVACCPVAQRSRALPPAVVLAVFLVKPNGILALPLHTAPFVLAAYVIAAGAGWRYRGRRDGETAPGRVRGLPGGEHPVLTNS